MDGGPLVSLSTSCTRRASSSGVQLALRLVQDRLARAPGALVADAGGRRSEEVGGMAWRLRLWPAMARGCDGGSAASMIFSTGLERHVVDGSA